MSKRCSRCDGAGAIKVRSIDLPNRVVHKFPMFCRLGPETFIACPKCEGRGKVTGYPEIPAPPVHLGR